MISLGLSSADQKLFEQSLYTGYNLKIVVQVLDTSHRYITDVSSMLIDGQVNYSYWDPISYSASLTLLDPDNLVGFDTSSPSDNALYADRMLRILYCVYSELLPKWVDIPIFCGPVTKVARDDAVLSVECQGKESLVTEPTMAWYAKTYPKGKTGPATIELVMREKAGETKFSLDQMTYTLGHDYVLNATSVIWTFVNTLSASRHIRQLFYDGRGVLRFRERPSRPVWTFTENTLLSVPKLDYNHAEIRNGVTVQGATPEGKKQLRAHRYLPDAHPSSGISLGRNGVKRIMMEILDDSGLATQAAVDAEANKQLALLDDANVGFEFDSFVIPHLEPGDIFHLVTRDVSIQLMLDQYSIPLKAGSPQTNGTIKRISSNRARIRPR